MCLSPPLPPPPSPRVPGSAQGTGPGQPRLPGNCFSSSASLCESTSPASNLGAFLGSEAGGSKPWPQPGNARHCFFSATSIPGPLLDVSSHSQPGLGSPVTHKQAIPWRNGDWPPQVRNQSCTYIFRHQHGCPRGGQAWPTLPEAAAPNVHPLFPMLTGSISLLTCWICVGTARASPRPIAGEPLVLCGRQRAAGGCRGGWGGSMPRARLLGNQLGNQGQRFVSSKCANPSALPLAY